MPTLDIWTMIKQNWQ